MDTEMLLETLIKENNLVWIRAAAASRFEISMAYATLAFLASTTKGSFSTSDASRHF